MPTSLERRARAAGFLIRPVKGSRVTLRGGCVIELGADAAAGYVAEQLGALLERVDGLSAS